MANRILLVEDKDSLREMLTETLERESFPVDPVRSVPEALARIRKGERYLAVLTDLKLPGGNGIDVLEAAREADSGVPVVVMTAFGSIETAVEAMKKGAAEFLAKPVDVDLLLLVVRRIREERRILLENIILREEYATKLGFPQIVGDSPPLRAVSDQIQRVAPTDATVLLQGESGTGKELFARAIHRLSPRKDRPFVAINCAAIPDTLMENELFGHEKGAYTGAAARSMGKFELAEGGTILLDEIAELGLGLQSKILRVIQERSFERIGGTTSITVDVRVIAASNRDLDAAVRKGIFREDLFFRLNVFPVTIPPLRVRKSDIPPLAQHFSRKYGRELGRGEIAIEEAAMPMLQEYHWPGNIRELENCIERAVILCEGGIIRPRDLNLRVETDDREARLREVLDLEGSLLSVAQKAAGQAERIKIRDTLELVGWNRTKAAELLQISYRVLLQKIRDHRLETLR
jgi:DNA-binding NtrC family response regulator